MKFQFREKLKSIPELAWFVIIVAAYLLYCSNDGDGLTASEISVISIPVLLAFPYFANKADKQNSDDDEESPE